MVSCGPQGFRFDPHSQGASFLPVPKQDVSKSDRLSRLRAWAPGEHGGLGSKAKAGDQECSFFCSWGVFWIFLVGCQQNLLLVVCC